MDNEKIVAKARLAADFMNNLVEAIETREDLIMSLQLEGVNYIPSHLSKTVLHNAIRVERCEIADNERREIAARLRQRRKEMDNEKPPRGYLFAAAVYLLEISNAVRCGESGALFYRLADLIDRPTCTFDGTPERIAYVCSNCGQTFTRRPLMARAFDNDIKVEIPFRFCPYCGAEVVTGDE